MPFEPWWQDLRSAARGLSRTRGFAAAAMLTLAIGIAATTGMFALIQGVLLRPLPVRDQNQLLIAWLELRASGAGHWPFQPEDIETLGRSSHLLDAVAGVDYNGVSATASVERGAADTATETVSQLGVTGRFFEVLGVQPLLGRVLTPADDVAGAENVIVISQGLWQRRYGGDPRILGRTLPLEEHPFRIVGVMPAEFAFPRGAEAWISIAATRAIADPRFAWGISVDLLARRKPQVTLDQAASELQALVAQLEARAPANRPRGLTPVVRTFTDIVVGDVRMPLLVLFAAVGLVLLIASANVANLLLMRGEGRRAELAVRIALGASHARLARQMLAESLLLALAAGAIGLALASWSLRPLIAWVPGGLPRLDAVRIDAGVIAFAMGVSLSAAMLASLVPILSSALRPGAFDLAMQLRSGGQSRGTVTRTARSGRRLLVIAQVALAVTVVAAAGLLTRSLLRLEAVDLGLAANRIVFVSLNFPASKYDDRARVFAFIDAMTARLDATPGIASSTAINTRPYAGTGGWDVAAFTAEGQTADRAARNPSLNLEGIDPSYFATFDVPILHGRVFADRDRHGAPPVAIISEDVAARLWPGEDPIGRRIKIGSPTSKEEWRTIVGVARSTRYRELAVPRPTLYLPARQFDTPGHTLALRLTTESATLANPASASGSNAANAANNAKAANIAAIAGIAVHAVDPDVQILRVEPFESLLVAPLARPRFGAFLIGLFGAIALLLAGIGLYAVMAAYVRQQYAEIGIRVALGATASDVRSLVIWEALRLAGGGAIIGLAIAMIASRLLRRLLYDVQPLDPAALLIAALLLVGVSALACYLPARRAVRIDPVTLLRAE